MYFHGPMVIQKHMDDLFPYEIPLKLDAKPFKQKNKPINPTLAPKMQQEMIKFRDGENIKTSRHSTWLSKGKNTKLCHTFIKEMGNADSTF